MADSWLELVDCVLRPARPRLEHCLREREHHRAAQQIAVQERARAIANCESRIEAVRERIFAADDGVIPSSMTALEREWRAISRTDPEGVLMDLWARIAPASWIDRKRWRDSDDSAKTEIAIALAADASGVEAAESAIEALSVALAAWGVQIGSRVRWRPFDADVDCVTELLVQPYLATLEAVTTRTNRSLPSPTTPSLERAVHEALLLRFPDRPRLAHSIAHAASVDRELHRSAPRDRPNPVTPLRAVWKAGYSLSAFDASGVTLEIPALL